MLKTPIDIGDPTYVRTTVFLSQRGLVTPLHSYTNILFDLFRFEFRPQSARRASQPKPSCEANGTFYKINFLMTIKFISQYNQSMQSAIAYTNVLNFYASKKESSFYFVKSPISFA